MNRYRYEPGPHGCWVRCPKGGRYVIHRNNYEPVLVDILRLFGFVPTFHIDGLAYWYDEDAGVQKEKITDGEWQIFASYAEDCDSTRSIRNPKKRRARLNEIHERYYKVANKVANMRDEGVPFIDSTSGLYKAVLSIVKKYWGKEQ